MPQKLNFNCKLSLFVKKIYKFMNMFTSPEIATLCKSTFWVKGQS